MYHFGRFVEKDEVKSIHHMEKALLEDIHKLASFEWKNGNYDRAMKHHIIAAALGLDESIKQLMDAFKKGYVNKEDLASALRAQQAAEDATKSPQRDEAEEYYRNNPDLLMFGCVKPHSIL